MCRESIGISNQYSLAVLHHLDFRYMHIPASYLNIYRKLGDGIRKCSIKHVVGASGEEIIKPLLPPVQGWRCDVRGIWSIYKLICPPTPHCKKKRYTSDFKIHAWTSSFKSLKLLVVRIHIHLASQRTCSLNLFHMSWNSWSHLAYYKSNCDACIDSGFKRNALVLLVLYSSLTLYLQMHRMQVKSDDKVSVCYNSHQ